MRALTLSEAIRYGSGVERPFLCPEHGDSRPSASVNVSKGVWYCYTCHAHGTLTGEARLAEPDLEQLKARLNQRMAEGRTYPESWLDRYDAGPVHPYWGERVGELTARVFRLGADPGADCVTYPLRDPSGAVLGVVRRSLGHGPKYLYPAGIDVGSLLFGYTPAHREAIVLVEGALDAIALWNVGVEAFAIYGSRLGPAQVHLIDRIDPEHVYTCYDQDRAGRGAHYETERVLRNRLVHRISWPTGWGKDIDEIGEERRRHVVDTLVSSGVSCIQ